MKLTVKTSESVIEAELDWDKVSEIKEHLKALGYRWDPTEKAWVRRTLPLHNPHIDALHSLGIKIPTVPYRFYRSYVYASPMLVNKQDFEYRVRHWKKATCKEYCAVKYPEWGECVDECRDGDWNTVLEVEDVVKLWKVADDGSIMVPRGLAHRIKASEGFLTLNYTTLQPIDSTEGLRDYQVQVASSALKAIEKYGGAIIQVATGGGKSYMAGWIARQLIRSGYNVVFTSLSIDLTRQLMEFAEKWNVPELAGNYNVSVKAVTIQTIYSRLLKGKPVRETTDEEDEEVQAYMDVEELNDKETEELKKIYYSRNTVVILDETHHTPAHTVREVMMHAGDGWGLRLGMSATPWRNDGRDLEVEAWVGPIVEPRINSSYLIQHGYAVPVEVNMIRTGNWGCVNEGNGAKAYSLARKCIAESSERNNLIKHIVANAPKPALVLTTLIKHANTLHSILQSLGSTAVVTGVVKGEVRARVFNMLKEGKVNILVATTLADEGLDLPPLRSLVLTMGGKSKTRVLQRVGRLVRPWQGKDKAIVYDIADEAWPFREQAEERIKLYRTEPYWVIREVRMREWGS